MADDGVGCLRRVVRLWLVTVAASASVGAGEAAKPLRFAVYGGVRGNAAVHRALVSQLAKGPPDFVLLTGQMVDRGDNTEQWADFDGVVAALGEGCPRYSCVGEGEGGRQFERRFGPPDDAAGTKSYYTFARKGVHFVVLDSLETIGRSDPQTRWLGKTLADLAGKPVVVLMHSPLFSIRGRGGSSDGRSFWHPLFAKHKVALVISGYQHFYFRTVQEGVTYVITSGGGAMLQRIESRRSLLPTDVVAAYYHYVEFTAAPGQLRGRVVDNEGVTRDEFAIALPKPAP